MSRAAPAARSPRRRRKAPSIRRRRFEVGAGGGAQGPIVAQHAARRLRLTVARTRAVAVHSAPAWAAASPSKSTPRPRRSQPGARRVRSARSRAQRRGSAPAPPGPATIGATAARPGSPSPSSSSQRLPRSRNRERSQEGSVSMTFGDAAQAFVAWTAARVDAGLSPALARPGSDSGARGVAVAPWRPVLRAQRRRRIGPAVALGLHAARRFRGHQHRRSAWRRRRRQRRGAAELPRSAAGPRRDPARA